MLLNPKEAEEICQEVDLGPHTLEYAYLASEQGNGCFPLVAFFVLLTKNIEKVATPSQDQIGTTSGN